MSSSVDKIKERLDIVEVVGSYIKLEKAGINFKGKCPFHNEKTPSFFVSPNRGSYYCFGCNAKGDIFTFVQEFEGLDFVGALKLLAERAGVVLERENPRQRTEKENLLKALEDATSFFENNLKENKEALNYLKNRGLNDDTISSWRLGFALDDWRSLFDYLSKNGYSKETLLKAGLIKKSDRALIDSDKKEDYYDVFRNRIIFPIFDVTERVIAYSGRLITEEKNAPKYLNSPDTPLFNKSETLYGFNKAKNFIHSKDYSILVEGQMDLLMSHQVGVQNTVASSGTAFTVGHLDKLKRVSNRIVLAFDADSAGFMASNKSAVLALSLGMEVKIASLPKGEDPASLALKNPDDWKDVLKKGKHLIDFYLDNLLSKELESRKLGKEIEKKLLPLIAILKSSIEKSHFISEISKRTRIKEEVLWDDLKKIAVPLDYAFNTEKNKDDEEIENSFLIKNTVEKHLIGIIFWQKSLASPHIDVETLLLNIKNILGEEYTNKIFEDYSIEKEELIFEAEAYYNNNEKLSKEIGELLVNLERDSLKRKLVLFISQLSDAEQSKDTEKIEKIKLNIQEINQRLGIIEKNKNNNLNNKV